MEWIPQTFEMPIQDEAGEIIGTKTYLFRWNARFSADEKRELTRILEKYDHEKVDRFISLLAEDCTKYGVFLKQKRNAEIKQAVEKFIPKLNNAMKALESINKQKWLLVEQMQSINCPANPQLNKIAYADIPTYSKKAFEYLKLLVDSLETVKPDMKRGRPQTEGGFAQAVADNFFEAFGESAPRSETGVLNDILSRCLEWMGLDYECVGRRFKTIVHK